MTSARDLATNAGLVLLGGILGAGLRAALLTLPMQSVWVTCAINLVGAFALGWLAAFAPPRLYAAAGVGVLGGFTTYSAFAFQVADTFAGAPANAVALAAVSLGGGVAAAAAGRALGGRSGAAQQAAQQAAQDAGEDAGEQDAGEDAGKQDADPGPGPGPGSSPGPGPGPGSSPGPGSDADPCGTGAQDA